MPTRLCRVMDGSGFGTYTVPGLACEAMGPIRPDNGRKVGRFNLIGACSDVSAGSRHLPRIVPAGAHEQRNRSVHGAALDGMTRPPAFWNHDGLVARLLSPLSYAVTAVTARRVARTGWRSPVPVICCGNATVGGAGKTTLALDLIRRLSARGVAVHVLSRGYGGTTRGPYRVRPGDTYAATGDEALLLAASAPIWIGGDRAASARAAIEAGAEILLIDDGLQNPTLEKTMSVLVIDGATGFGNGRVLPAGPLREPVAAAASRCRAAVLIGPDTCDARARLPPDLPVLRAKLVQGSEVAALAGRRALAFAGIAIPEKFFAGLERAGVVLAGRVAFPDHHAFKPKELARLEANAKELDAVLVTTPKDAVRLPVGMNVHVVSVRLAWETEMAIESLIDQFIFECTSPVPPVHGMTGF
jgi:tetraacyldisaccharide 4'-kinase